MPNSDLGAYGFFLRSYLEDGFSYIFGFIFTSYFLAPDNVPPPKDGSPNNEAFDAYFAPYFSFFYYGLVFFSAYFSPGLLLPSNNPALPLNSKLNAPLLLSLPKNPPDDFYFFSTYLPFSAISIY